MKTPPLALILLSSLFYGSLRAAPMKVIWELSDTVKNPESVVYDKTTQSYFVSNIDGAGDAKDGNGFITQLNSSGKVTQAQWVKELNAPKGLAVSGSTLWVSDIDQLVEINIAQAKVIQKISVPNAKFLNDVACAPDGTVFVSDTLGNQVFKYDGKTVSALATSTKFESPNGLLVEGNKLLVASWGLTSSFEQKPKVAGRLFTVDLDGKNKKVVSASFGQLDGLEKSGSKYIVSDWLAGKLYSVSANGKISTLSVGKTGYADIGIGPTAENRTVVVLPQMMENKVTAYEL